MAEKQVGTEVGTSEPEKQLREKTEGYFEKFLIPYFFQVKYGKKEVENKIITFKIYENNVLYKSFPDHSLETDLLVTLKKSVLLQSCLPDII